MTSPTPEQWASVLQRLEALERRTVDAPAPAAESRFWLLEALRAQLPPQGGAVVYGGIVHLPAGPLEWQIGRAQGDLLGADWPALAARLAALGHRVRLALLRALVEGPATVQALAALPGLGTTGQLYHHLRELESTGWVHSPERGRYAVPPERVVPLLAVLSAARS